MFARDITSPHELPSGACALTRIPNRQFEILHLKFLVRERAQPPSGFEQFPAVRQAARLEDQEQSQD